MSGQCDECGGYVHGSRHTFKPEWEVWDARDGTRDEALTIRATDEEDAAEVWAERSDVESLDHSIVGCNHAEVCVAKPGKQPSRWWVHGQSVPRYSARKAAKR